MLVQRDSWADSEGPVWGVELNQQCLLNTGVPFVVVTMMVLTTATLRHGATASQLAHGALCSRQGFQQAGWRGSDRRTSVVLTRQISEITTSPPLALEPGRTALGMAWLELVGTRRAGWAYELWVGFYFTGRGGRPIVPSGGRLVFEVCVVRPRRVFIRCSRSRRLVGWFWFLHRGSGPIAGPGFV